MKNKWIGIKKRFTVLIADKNSNVLNFLKRELVKEGYRVLTANDSQKVMGINNHKKPDLLIIDPFLPGVNCRLLLSDLKEQRPNLPILIHSYISDFHTHPKILDDVFFIEKAGNSIENMKKVISDIN